MGVNARRRRESGLYPDLKRPACLLFLTEELSIGW